MTKKNTKKNTKNADRVAKQDISSSEKKDLRIDKKFILSLLSFIVTILGAVPAISHIFYASRAEKYYGIPSLYLRHNLFGDFGTLVALVVAAILLCIFPFIFKMLLEGILESKVLNTLIKLLFSISLGLVAYQYVIFCSTILFMNGQESFQENGNICIGAACFGVLAGFVYYTILVKDFTEPSDRSKGDLMRGLSCSISKKTSQKTIYVLYSFIFTIAFIFLLFTGNKVSPFKPESVRNYEILLDEKSEYNVVVGNHGGSAVLMKGTITGNSLLIKKGHYRIEPLGKRQIEYHRFGDVDVE